MPYATDPRRGFPPRPAIQARLPGAARDALFSRREAALGAAAFALVPTRRNPLDAAGEAGLPRLRELAGARGITYGAHPFAYPPVITPGMAALVADQCAVVAPVLHWRLVERRRGTLDFGADLGVAALAGRLGQPMTGVHLLWHEALPAWFADLPGRAEKEAAVVRYIHAMGREYSGRFWSVNVVNEALRPGDGLAGGLRQSPLYDSFGDAYWDFAFRAAREAFPESLLVYNDYGMEQDSGGMRAKRRALLHRLDALRAAGTPIDAVGLQSHLALDHPLDAAGFTRFLGEVAACGVAIILSELDVLDASAPADIGARDCEVASMYRRYLDAALAEPAVRGVVTWGLSDSTTWLNGRRLPWLRRHDALPMRPLPFDADLRPKPAFAAVAEAFRAALPRGR